MAVAELRRTDLRTFDQEMTDLIMEMTDHGWTGRVSSNGHAIMRAPDGEDTHSISRSSLRGRSGRNARAAFDRWLRQQPAKEPEMSDQETTTVTGPGGTEHSKGERPGDPEEEGYIKEYKECPTCHESVWRDALGPHMKLHIEARPCSVCGRSYKYLDTHIRSKHGVRLGALPAPVPAPIEGPVKYTQDESDAINAVRALIARNQNLHEILVRARKERDDLQARIDLIRETMNV